MRDWIVAYDSKEESYVSKHHNYESASKQYDIIMRRMYDEGPYYEKEELDKMSLVERLEDKIPRVYIAEVKYSSSQEMI